MPSIVDLTACMHACMHMGCVWGVIGVLLALRLRCLRRCLPGYEAVFPSWGLGMITCRAVEKGTFKDMLSNTPAQNCPFGAKSETVGADSLSLCVCGAGEYRDTATNRCMVRTVHASASFRLSPFVSFSVSLSLSLCSPLSLCLHSSSLSDCLSPFVFFGVSVIACLRLSPFVSLHSPVCTSLVFCLLACLSPFASFGVSLLACLRLSSFVSHMQNNKGRCLYTPMQLHYRDNIIIIII